jgi:hypothetical protein
MASQTVNFENDYLIREMASKLDIHQGFGHAPSVEMLLQELAKRAQEVGSLLPMKDPAPLPSSRIFDDLFLSAKSWLLNMDNLF